MTLHILLCIFPQRGNIIVKLGVKLVAANTA